MTTTTPRALDANETRLVEQSKDPKSLTPRELTELVRQLRQRRERVQRLIRNRNRSARQTGRDNADTGARDKKAVLVAAIDRVTEEMKRRKPTKQSAAATDNLKQAVKRVAKVDVNKNSEQTPDTGPAETPNDKIAPSGALHAEGHRPALGRSRGR